MEITHPAEKVHSAIALFEEGLSEAAVSGKLGVARATLRGWRSRGLDSVAAVRSSRAVDGRTCTHCSLVANVPKSSYAYLLGLYLGDGTVSKAPKHVYKLRIMCCDAYPGLVEECRRAMQVVVPDNRVGTVQREGCKEVYAYSRHWVCLFPQTGPGRKHSRTIALEHWQRDLVADHPEQLIRGLLHSDGCRVINRVRVRSKWYAYPRYFFSNVSSDIRQLFCDTCDLVGIEWRQNRWNSISVARRASVEFLDSFVGPKS